jgi:histidinol-phosphate aminotransferase
MTLQTRIETLVRPEIQSIKAYPVANAQGLIKLDAMENPYPWPEAMRTAWATSLSQVQINRYPDPQARDIQASLRSAMGIAPDMGLLLGNGSDEIIQMLMLALGKPGAKVLAVEPSFVMYAMIARFCGLDYLGVPLRATDFSLDLPALLGAIETHRPALIFLAWPNNPTGNLFAQDEVMQLIQAAPGLVIIDEAYGPFTDASFLDQLGRFDNLLVMRTLSKMGLAGLRLGYLLGPQAWIDQIDKVRMPYNINSLSQVSARFALEHKAVFDAQAQSIRSERERVFQALGTLPGLTAFTSEANFILVRTPQGRAKALFEGLKTAGLLVKCLDGAHPLLADCLRLTIGTPEENQLCIKAMQHLL